eukprot:TRINITY_DN5329_c0_g1_i3.p2 TRINITY_DN5329_c0_g1~~TRINITY_DN5329_c0_g1_i3.p2  ORF type:complete len:227 (-),score=57.51 TRINITY_DN5329_c0_g1_i3:271-951(-)
MCIRDRFIIELLHDGIKPDGSFLEPQTKTVTDLGGKYPYLMRYKYEIYRFLTPNFLHINFAHIMYNSLFQIFFGMPMEKRMGCAKITVIYILSGIGANLFSSLMSDALSVGASTCIFGLIGTQLTYIFMNWRFFGHAKSGRDYYLVIIIFVIVINFSLSMQSSNIDFGGHVGGLLIGIFLGMVVVKREDGNASTCLRGFRILGILVVLLFFVLGFLAFYTVRQPHN